MTVTVCKHLEHSTNMNVQYHCLAILFLCFLSKGKCAGEKTCSEQNDCIDKDVTEKDRCSICVDGTGKGNGKCIYIYNREYLKTPSCEKYNNTNCGGGGHCGNGSCLTSGDYHDTSIYYSPYCRCVHGPLRTYGEHCQYENPNNLSVYSYIRRKFDGMVPVCQRQVLTFNFFSWYRDITDNSFDIYLKVGVSSYCRFQNPQDLMLRRTQFYGKIDINTVFPYKTEASVFKLGDEYIGYQTNVIMIIYYEGKIAFHNSWDIFVNYDKLKCLPIISMENCADDMSKPEEMLRSTMIHIDIDVEYIADGSRISTSVRDLTCKVSEKLSWKVWKLDREKRDFLPDYENYTRTAYLHFDPFTLDIGLYEAQIEVTNVESETYVTNVKHCFFKITCIPLVAKIEGGSDRMVSPNVGLTLVAENSFDPNMPTNFKNHIKIEWTCVNILFPKRKHKMCEPKRSDVLDHYFVKHTLLTPGAIYNFTLKIWTDKYNDNLECKGKMTPSFAYVTVRVANLNETDLGNVMIQCLQNCGLKVVPNNELYLKAKQQFTLDSNDTKYVWTYHESGQKEALIGPLRNESLASHFLLIKENTFKLGRNYTIVVRVNNSTWFAKYIFETYDIDYKVDCRLVPGSSGVKGNTPFNINCTIISNPNMALLTFEFYDKTDEEKKEGFIFSGRMLGTSRSGQLSDMRLTRGNLIIYVLDNHGLYLEKNFSVSLRDWEINDEVLKDLYENATNKLIYGSLANMLGAISFIPDVIPAAKDKDKGDILNSLIIFLTDLTLANIEDMKLCVSTLNIILLSLNKPKQLQLNINHLTGTFNIIKHLADIFSQDVLSGDVQNMNPKEIKQISVVIFNCLQAVLLSRDKSTEEIEEGDFSFSVESKLRESSLNVELVLSLIADALSFIQLPGQPVTKISSKDEAFVSWVMENEENSSITDLISAVDGIPVIFSNELFNSLIQLLHEGETIALQVIFIKENIYWWCKSDVQSRLVSVAIKIHNNKNNLEVFQYTGKPMSIVVDLYDNLTTTKVNDTAFLPDPDVLDPISLDLEVKIHRFDPVLRSLTTIKFHFPQTNGSLRVFVMVHFRPDYNIMQKKGIVVTNSTPIYQVPYYHYDEPYFLFMGVLPGPDVAVNNSVSYTFEISTIVCKLWSEAEWTSIGCNIKKVENNKQVHCECTHFSIFSAAFPVPPNQVDPFKDAKLFLTVLENPLVVGFVSGILLIYLLLCLLLCRMDYNISKKRTIIILADNMPFDKFPYLIAVYTSPRMHAGTRANVGIKLVGSTSNSRHHILCCKDRAVLRTDSDDWFLVCCPESLGDLEGLHIWHDNTGFRPEWLCEKIVVYDLLQNTETLFILNEWVSLNEGKHPEAYVLPAGIESDKNVKSIFLENVVLGLKEKHVLLSCLISHPRSDLSRVERLSIYMCSLMVAMMCSIMFYLPSSEQSSYVDTYHYSIGTRQVYVSLQTLLISVCVSFIVSFLFRKSYKITYSRNKVFLHVRRDSESGKLIQLDDNQKNTIDSTVYKNFVNTIMKVFKSRPMKPVQLPNSKSVVKVCRFWLFLSWVVCVTLICLCSYLIMIYGLKLGLVNSKQWLSSLFMASGGEIILFTPIRIIFMSSILAIALLKMFDLSLHQASINSLELVKTPNTQEHIQNVMLQRQHPMYQPLLQQHRYNIVRKLSRKKRWWKRVDFIVIVTTLIAFNNLIFQMFMVSFNTTTHVVKMMTETKQEILENVNFNLILTISSFERYLQYTFLTCLYNLWWYNDRLLSLELNSTQNEYWTLDSTNRLLGVPMIRQLRVKPRKCYYLIYNISTCVPRWSSKSQDKDDYGEMWEPASWSDVTMSNSPWRYNEPSRTTLLNKYRLYSPTGVTYDTGGYVKVLSPTSSETKLQLVELQEDAWQNKLTKVVFVEFSLYNVNEQQFIQVTLMVEYLRIGAALTKGRASAFKFGDDVNVWNILFLALLVYYLFKCIHIMNREGLGQLFSHFENVCQTLMVILGFLSLIIFTIHYFVSTRYLESFQRKGLSHYFDFDLLINYASILRHVLSLLQFVAILNALVLLRNSRTLMKHFYTLVNSLYLIIWLTITCHIIIGTLSVIKTTTNVSKTYDLKTLTINAKSLGHIELSEFQYLYEQLFAISRILLIAVCNWCFLINFIHVAKLY